MHNLKLKLWGIINIDVFMKLSKFNTFLTLKTKYTKDNLQYIFYYKSNVTNKSQRKFIILVNEMVL